MTTPADVEQQIVAIDARRAAVIAEKDELAHRTVAVGTTSPAIAARLAELGAESARLLHGDRVRAQQQLARLQQRERGREAMIKAVAVAPEHRAVCARIAELAGELAHTLEAEAEMHQQLVAAVGTSQLPGLVYDDARFRDRLERLAEIARITANAKPSPASEQEPAKEVVA